jgi:hypothetical protein
MRLDEVAVGVPDGLAEDPDVLRIPRRTVRPTCDKDPKARTRDPVIKEERKQPWEQEARVDVRPRWRRRRGTRPEVASANALSTSIGGEPGGRPRGNMRPALSAELGTTPSRD